MLIPLHELYYSNCFAIPDKPGIYFILAPKDMEIQFLPTARNSHAPFYGVNILQEKYALCKDREILYIGKASGQKGLKQRLRQYMRYGWNEAVNHKGGRAIWQIEGAENLLLSYEICQDADAKEHALLAAYKRDNDSYPLANWRG